MASEKVDIKVFVHYIGQWIEYRDAMGVQKQMLKAVVVDPESGVTCMWAYDRANLEAHVRP